MSEVIEVSTARRANWARDFAVVGGVSSFLAPILITGTALGMITLFVTTAAGALSGALLGGLLRRPLRGALGSAPWPLLVLLCLGIGACWGALVGAVGASTLMLDAAPFSRGEVLPVYVYFMSFAAVAAAAQLAWFGVAYARTDRADGPTWPLLLAAAGTPFLGWAGLGFVSSGMWLLGR